jgi:hypothetical protein
MSRLIFLLFLAVTAGAAVRPGGPAKCMGGTLPMLRTGMNGEVLTGTPDAFVFVASSGTVRIPYDKINLIEYGQDVGRRVVLAWVISPIFLLLKSRKHFITVGFQDAEGRQQALVLRLDKRIVRSTLATIEARSGRTWTYQDQDARKYHRGG